jgi:hypothetical protein
VGIPTENFLCNKVKKFSNSQGVLNVAQTSHLEEGCCKKCGIAMSARRRVCVLCCEIAGSKWKHNVSKKTVVAKKYMQEFW